MTRILYFTAAWCRPCRSFGPLLSKVALELNLQMTRVDLDADTTTPRVYGVMSVPTVIVERDGEVIDRFGQLTPAALRDRLGSLT